MRPQEVEGQEGQSAMLEILSKRHRAAMRLVALQSSPALLVLWMMMLVYVLCAFIVKWAGHDAGPGAGSPAPTEPTSFHVGGETTSPS